MPAPAWSAQRRERSEVIEAYGADFAEDARRRLLLDLLCRQVRRKHQPQFQTSLRTPERWDCSAVEVLKPSSSPLEFEWPTSQQSTIRSPRLAFWPTVRPGVLTGCSCFRVIATASRAGRSREQAHTPRPGWRGRSGQRANGLAGLSRLHQSLRLLSSPGSSRLESRRASETTLSKRISFPACPSSVGLGLLRSGARCARVVGACRPRAFLPHPVNHRSRLARHPGGAAAPAPRKMSQQGANPVIDERARRVKNLLEAYYGAEGHHHAHAASQGAGGSDSKPRLSRASTDSSTSSMVGASPLDISGFNPDNFVNSMMQKLRLRDLMSAHVAMAHEVRALNSELQALVYQNYSKFLDSTDSIRVMRKELFSMGSRLRDLQGEMKRVADSSARIDARIRPRRQSVGELGEVRSVLQRLETVFALPTKLRMALDRGSLDIATGYYAAARPVLDAFGHQGGLRTVLAECRPLVDRLRRSLRARLADGEEGALDLLEKIGDDVTDLRDEMLLGMLVPVRRELKRCAKEAARLSGCAEAELLPPAAPVAAGDSFASAVKASDVPLPSGAEDLVRHMGAAVLGALTAAVNRHRTLFPVSKEDKAAAARDAGVVFPLVGCYMRQVAAIASSLAPRASVVGGKKVWEGFATPALWKLDFGTQALLNVIKQVLEDTHGCAALDALGARSSWVGASLALACARQHVASCVAFGPAATLLCLREAARPGSAVPLSADVMERCRSALRSGLEACFQSLRPVLVPTQALVGVPVPYDMPKWAAQCLSQGFADLQRHMMRMVGQGPHPEGGAMRGRDKDAASFRVQKAACLGPSSWRQGQSLVDTAAAGACGVAWELASDAARAPDAAVAALAGSRLAAGVLEQSVVARVSEALTSAAPGAAIGTGQAFDASEVSRQLGEASSRLLARWVQLRGREISAALRGSVAGVAGRAGGAPAGPSVVSSAVVEGLERAAAEVAAALPDRANRGGGSDALAAWLGPPPHVFAGAPSVVQSGNIEREMDVLFGNRIKVFGPVEAAQGSLVAAVAKIALKTLVELIRDSHVVPGAVKQLQLDLALIARSLAPMASPAGSQALKTLLDDAAGALYARGGIKAAMAREDLSAAVVRSSKPGS